LTREATCQAPASAAADARGLFVGGDGQDQGGKLTGRVAFYDLNTVPAPTPVETTITTPIEGRVVASGVQFTIQGQATAPGRVRRVQVEVQDRNTKQYLQDDLTTWGGVNNVYASLATANATATAWSLPVAIIGNRELQLMAKTFAICRRTGRSPPTSTPSGARPTWSARPRPPDSTRSPCHTRASGACRPRPSTTTASRTCGGSTRDWVITSTGAASSVAINAPAPMTPTTAAPAYTVAPGGRLTFTGTDSSIEVLHLDLAGTATDDQGVAGVRVALEDQDTGRYLQPNGTMAAAFATLSATLASPNATSTSWTLAVDLPTKGEFAVTAFAVDTAGQQDTSTSGATARYLVYPGDLDPTISDTLFSPTEGTAFTDARIFVSGRAEDDTAMGEVEVAIVNSANQSWRSAFLNSRGTPGSNFSYTTPVIPSGAYTVRARAVDAYGQVQAVPREAHVTVSAPPATSPRPR
jgi:hypothetical protein